MLNLLMKPVNAFIAVTQPPVYQPASYNHSVRFFPGKKPEYLLILNESNSSACKSNASEEPGLLLEKLVSKSFKELVLLCFMLFNSLGASYNVQGQENLNNL